ncbi:MAG: NAD kinase [Bacteroidales bacterium]|nr:NAD kinase [Bacteroidales bacterium]
MRIALFGKVVADDHFHYIQLLTDRLEEEGIGLMVYRRFYEAIRNRIRFQEEPELFGEHFEVRGRADFLLSFGGDGTLLDTITLVRDSGIPIMGINLGRMGFLSSIPKEQIELSVSHLLAGNYHLDQRSLIRLESPGNLFGDVNYALNDITLLRKEPGSMLTIKVHINGEYLNDYWADGLIVATPTGSTAYSLSAGGPILMPDARSFVITPIANHNLTVRPIVIPDTGIISIRVNGRHREYNLGLDSRSVAVPAHTELTLCKEQFQINLLQMKDEYFFRTIRNKLLWGLDVRN